MPYRSSSNTKRTADKRKTYSNYALWSMLHAPPTLPILDAHATSRRHHRIDTTFKALRLTGCNYLANKDQCTPEATAVKPISAPK
eukprot:3973713-Pleurochrysis_carterae.AAC.1